VFRPTSPRAPLAVPPRNTVGFSPIARGSLSELDTQLQIARRLGFGHGDGRLAEDVDKVFARLTALMNALDKRDRR